MYTMTTKEAADKIGSNVSYVQRLCMQGKLDAKKFGRDWLIDPESVIQYIAQRKEKRGKH